MKYLVPLFTKNKLFDEFKTSLGFTKGSPIGTLNTSVCGILGSYTNKEDLSVL